MTLTDCETGLGKIAQGEGILGFSRALLYAGAKNLMLSFWQVNDQSTQEFMVDFYRKVISENKPLHQAISESKQKLLGHEDYAHSYYWALFILIEGRL